LSHHIPFDLIFDYLGLGAGSFPWERILALGAASALFVAAAWEQQRNGVQL
jgi:hypothetical protein